MTRVRRLTICSKTEVQPSVKPPSFQLSVFSHFIQFVILSAAETSRSEVPAERRTCILCILSRGQGRVREFSPCSLRAPHLATQSQGPDVTGITSSCPSIAMSADEVRQFHHLFLAAESIFHYNGREARTWRFQPDCGLFITRKSNDLERPRRLSLAPFFLIGDNWRSAAAG